MQKFSLEIKQFAPNPRVAGGQEYIHHHFASQSWNQRTIGCLVYRLARKTRLSLQCWSTVDGDQPISISPTKIRKSKNTSYVSAVRVHPCGRRENCNTMYSSESYIMEEAPFDSSSDIRRAISVPPRPKIKPIRAARTDTGTFVDAEPDA